MGEIYTSFFGNKNEVCMVDTNIKREIKTKISWDFENVDSKARIVVGTKLLPNRLDCTPVKLVCLADCKVDAIDHLQMVGKFEKVTMFKYLRLTKTFGTNSNHWIGWIFRK